MFILQGNVDAGLRLARFTQVFLSVNQIYNCVPFIFKKFDKYHCFWRFLILFIVLEGALDLTDLRYIFSQYHKSDVSSIIAKSLSFQSSARMSRTSNKRTWTEQLAVEEREKEREHLQKLQNRTNYLKNPRFDASQAKLLTTANRPQAKDINIKRSPTEIEPIEKVQVCQFADTCTLSSS